MSLRCGWCRMTVERAWAAADRPEDLGWSLKFLKFGFVSDYAADAVVKLEACRELYCLL